MKENTNLKLSNEEINKLTRKSIQEALVYLLGKKDLANISVTEIVSKAGVSRSAYYRNYKSKEDILKDFSISVFYLLFDELNTDEKISQPEKWYQFLFQTIKDNERITRLIFKAKVTSILEYLPDINMIQYDKKEEYQLNALLSALISVTEMWVNHDFDLTVDEIAALCFEIFPNIRYLIKI